LPDSLRVKDIQLIKDMGANFIRLAHYPQDPIIYKACDELGLLVWDELPWCRGGMGNSHWKKNTTNLLTDQIIQNRNHPSIIMWSLGNEIDWLPDSSKYSSIDSINNFLVQLNTLAKKLDESRVTCIRKYYQGSNLVDVFSPSIWAGWYAGNFYDYEFIVNASQKKYKRFIHAEYGGDSHFGRHSSIRISNNADGNNQAEEMVVQKAGSNIASTGDWSESYINQLFDWHLKTSETNDSLTGNIQWAFKDFATPLRPENPIPYINQKGLVDRAGNPKDGYYIFKSYWTTNPKFCYIESHTEKTKAGKINLPQQINVYSNCQKVNLYLNGQYISERSKDINAYPASGLSWQLLFKTGINSIVTEGYSSDSILCRDSISFNFITDSIGSPDKIELNHEKLANGNFLIHASVVDKKGNLCLNYSKRIYFSKEGDGNLVENQGTPIGSSTIEAANGKASILFIPTTTKGKAIIEVRNQDFKGAYLNLIF